ncbi:MAG: hypothetical protein ACK5Q5_06975, partial [Planctomycetaceae bacterium]
ASGAFTPWFVLFHAPWLLLTWSAWKLSVWLSTEPPFHQLTSKLWIGRRLSSTEIPAEFENIIDLTAEFIEPVPSRAFTGYIAFPILDGGIPDAKSLVYLYHRLESLTGTTYIHCAQGHGRTALVTAGWLLYQGAVSTPEAALQLVQSVRPQATVNRGQRAFLDQLGDRLQKSQSHPQVDRSSVG